jgi:N6-adenosine-specific RNA methylase IME4
MDLDWIRRLPVKDIVAEDAGLALWVYGPMLREAFDVMDSWGFSYKSDLFTWQKIASTGDPAFGTGYYTRKSTEQLLYATRGRGLQRIDRGVPQCIACSATGTQSQAGRGDGGSGTIVWPGSPA